ncbi:hypothetical protein [Vibrio cyclitrophicus]|uniref:hypothetical protein n=3 Tax=Vibrio cyclitrophicus TaxID=47951 RepID=UPI00399B474B
MVKSKNPFYSLILFCFSVSASASQVYYYTINPFIDSDAYQVSTSVEELKQTFNDICIYGYDSRYPTSYYGTSYSTSYTGNGAIKYFKTLYSDSGCTEYKRGLGSSYATVSSKTCLVGETINRETGQCENPCKQMEGNQLGLVAFPEGSSLVSAVCRNSCKATLASGTWVQGGIQNDPRPFGLYDYSGESCDGSESSGGETGGGETGGGETGGGETGGGETGGGETGGGETGGGETGGGETGGGETGGGETGGGETGGGETGGGETGGGETGGGETGGGETGGGETGGGETGGGETGGDGLTKAQLQDALQSFFGKSGSFNAPGQGDGYATNTVLTTAVDDLKTEIDDLEETLESKLKQSPLKLGQMSFSDGSYESTTFSLSRWNVDVGFNLFSSLGSSNTNMIRTVILFLATLLAGFILLSSGRSKV